MLVSLIIPCYNQAQFLDETLHSVLKQTYENWECILVDDGSTDETETIAKKWVNKDSRFFYYYKHNEGLSSTRNYGLTHANGSYVQFLDSDDCLEKNKLERSLNVVNSLSNNSKKVVITDYKVLFDKTKELHEFKLNPLLLNFDSVLCEWDNLIAIPIHCGFFDIKFFNEFKFPQEVNSKEDWVMWVSLFKKGYETFHIPEPLVIYRKHHESMTMVRDMLPDYIKATNLLKSIISANEYEKMLISLFSKYYNKSIYFKKELTKIKKLRCVRLYHTIKKTTKKIINKLCSYA